MKNLRLVVLALCALSLALPTSVLADKANGKKAKLFAKYDKNKNDALDADEVKAIQADFAKDKDGELKAFDKNHDGKLSDEELTTIKPGSGKAKQSGSKGKKQGTETTTAESKPAEDSKTAPEPDTTKPKTDK